MSVRNIPVQQNQAHTHITTHEWRGLIREMEVITPANALQQELNQIRDSLDLSQQRPAILSSNHHRDTTAQAALHVSRIELARCLEMVKRITGTETVEIQPRAATTQVFSTEELLEMFLKHLEPMDLLQATQTCNATAALIDASKRTRKAMCVQTDPEAVDVWPFGCRNDLSFETRDAFGRDGKGGYGIWVEARFVVSNLPSLG